MFSSYKGKLWKFRFQWTVCFVNKNTIVGNPQSGIDLISFPPHLVKKNLQLFVVLFQLRQLGQDATTEVEIHQAGRAELSHPWLLWTQTLKTFCKRPEKVLKTGVCYIFLREKYYFDKATIAIKTLFWFLIGSHLWSKCGWTIINLNSNSRLSFLLN